jgi:hypothetical protein
MIITKGSHIFDILIVYDNGNEIVNIFKKTDHGGNADD